MESTSGGSSKGWEAGGDMPRGNGNHKVNWSTARRSSRKSTNRIWVEAAARFSTKNQNGATEEEGWHRMSETINGAASASPTPRDSSATSGSKDGAKRQRSELPMDGSITSLSKKPKRMNTKGYLALFKPPRKVEDAGLVVKTAEQSSIPTTTKKVKESPFQKLQRLPNGCHRDFDNDHLSAVNKLREFWHKSQGAAFVDDKEAVMKTILFIMCLSPDVCRPFLVVTDASHSLWEAEFKRFAPSVNVVVYDGDKDMHKSIQDPTFNTNGSSMMSHVILARPDVILEDIETARSVAWEAVIVDYCRNSAPRLLKQLKQLPTDCRIVLLSSPPEDNLLEYKNLVAFLNSKEEDLGDHADNNALVILKARFKRHVAYERKTDSSNYLEYWVPTYLSQVQLQLYSSILLTNSSVLQSQVATDSVGDLGHIVLCLWKCCDHPCLVDEFPHDSLANIADETESIDNRMRASGKLLLLEKMLREFRNMKSRVIVLFQSDGPGENKMGKILEEFVRHRFGPESYERVQNCSAYSKKQAATSMFNDRTKGRFVFLIENHACHSSIKLSAIDAVIIYGSDLNPLNDLKALGKIKIESEIEHVKIFRLYTPFTVEEKGLVLAKQGMVIDCKVQDIAPSLSHRLLSWGVSFCFSRLDVLHQDNPASISSGTGMLCMDKVISEFLTVLSTNSDGPTISIAHMSGEFYSRNITLIGEREGASSLDIDPPRFWLNLLDGKSPSHHYLSEPPQVKHRSLQIMEELTSDPAEESNKGRRQFRKAGETADSSSKFSSDVNNNDTSPEFTPSGADLQLLGDTQHKLGVGNLSTPKSLHVQLKCELSKLIKVLKLPDNVRLLAEQLLEYLLKNHLVVREPWGILHAFNIALCWRAASLLKYNKLDHRDSLALAASCLNYEHNEELAGVFYKKFATLKEKVLCKPGENRNKVENGIFSSQESSSKNLRSSRMFQKQTIDLHGSLTNSAPRESSSGAEQMVSDVQVVSAPEANRECHFSSGEHPNMIIKKRIDLFDKVFSVRENNIHEKQQLEILDFQTYRENQITILEEVCSLVLRYIRRSGIDEGSRKDQTELMIKWFTMLAYAFLEHMKLQLNKLEALQSTTWFKERLMKDKLKEELLSGQLDQCLDLCTALPDSNFVIEEFIHFKKQIDDYHVGKVSASGCDLLLDDRLITEITLVRNAAPSEAVSTRPARNEPAEALVGSGRASAPESVLPENSIDCSSDGIKSLADSQHPPEEAESAGILGTTVADDLQRPTSDQTAQAERTGMLGTADPYLQHEVQPPTTTQRTSVLQSVESSGDPHAEPSGTSGMVAPLDLMPEVQSSSSTQNGPVGAERPGASGTILAPALQPETQPSVSVQHVPPEETQPDEMIQIGLPAQQCTDLHSQQSLAASWHPPEQAERADILGMVVADALQPSTLSLDQNAEAERPGTLDAGAAQDLQTEMLPSTSTNDVPCEETDLSSMAVGTTSQQSLQASRDTHAEREPDNALGMLAAHDLQFGMQPSSSVQDQPVEAGAGTSDTISAQYLQPGTQPSTVIRHITPERTHPDERIQTSLQPNGTPGPQLLTQLSSSAPAAVNNLKYSSDPLRNELETLKCWNTLLFKNFEKKKLLLQIEYNQELEKLNKKYESLHHKELSTYRRLVTKLEDISQKVSMHQLLAENFHENFAKYQYQESLVSPTIGQVQQAPARTSGAQTTASPVVSLSATQPQVSTSFHSIGPFRSETMQLQTQPVVPGNLYRATSSPLSSLSLQNGNNGVAGAQPRGHAPRPHHLRMQPPYATFWRDHQQHSVMGPGLTSPRHPAPGTLTSALAGVPVTTSMASSSVRQTMASASNPHSALPASSLLSGSLAELMANFVPPSGTNSVFMATQQVYAAAGIWHAGAHIAGVNHPVPESTLETLPFQQRWNPDMVGAVLPSIAASSANPSASNSEPALPTSSANPIFMAAQQGLSPHTTFHNHPGPLNAAAGIWNTGTHIAGVSTPVSESALETLPFQQRWHPDMAGAVLPSIVSSLANPSASNSEPALPTSSVNPIFIAAQQGQSPHTAFHNHPGPLNAASGIWNNGTHVAGVSPPVPESALMNTLSAGRTGMTSEPPSTGVQRGGGGEVVCLSDDE